MGSIATSLAPIALFTAGILIAQAPAPLLDLRISKETVPAGGMAQIKVFLGTPRPISSGSIVITFSGIGPGSQPPVQAATVFSATGDAAATGTVDPDGTFELVFTSPSAGVGRLTGVPILEFSIPVASGFAVVLDPRSSFAGPAGDYAIASQAGGAAIGGALSVQSVTPTGSTGILPAGSVVTIAGTGFQSATAVRIEGVAASADIVSPSLINLTLAGATEITGKQIVISNPDGAQVSYWGGLGTSLYTFPLTPTYSAICGRMGPAFEDPASLVVQNPNRAPAQVTISNAFITAPGQSLTVTVPAGGSYRTALSDPPYSTVQSDPSTPVRVLSFVSYSYSFDPLGILPVVSQAGPIHSIGSIVNAASQIQSAVSPGEIITLYGTNMGPTVPIGVTVDSFGAVARNLSGAQVLFDGIPAPLLYASASQVNAVVPYETFSDRVTTVQVEFNGAASAAWGVPVAAAAPAIFTLSSNGQGNAAILNQDNSVNSPTNSAQAGSTLQIYATGEGLTTPAATTGVVVDGGSLRNPLLPVRVTVGGENAVVVYAGSSAGSVAGLFQVNAQLPEDLAPGLAIPVVLMVGSEASQAAVTVAVK